MLTLLSGVCLLAAGTAIAQDRSKAGIPEDGIAALPWTEPATRWQKASDILGKKVECTNTVPCGTVNDLIVDIPSGRVIFMIIHVDGKYAVIPSAALTLPSHAEKYMLIATKERTKTFCYDKDRLPDFSDRAWADQVYNHYQVKPYWSYSKSAKEEQKENPAWCRYTEHWHKATDLLGTGIKNEQDEDLGRLDEVIIDPDRNRSIYGILSHGGVLGIGDKLFAVPWSSLTTMSSDHKFFILNVDKDRLKNATGFDKKTWPNFTDDKWAIEIHSYYSRKPYWQDYGEYNKDNKRNP